MGRRTSRGRWLARAAVGAVATVVLTAAAPVHAAQGSIDHVESKNGKLQVLYSLPPSEAGSPDLGSLRVDLAGTTLNATATLASQAKNAVRRTAVLAIDVSRSMQAKGKFTAAKKAAQAFLDTAPSDLYVGVVTFAGSVQVAQPPSLDRAATTRIVNGLNLSQGTFLYQGLERAVQVSGTAGQRSVIVLSDGRDTSGSPLAAVTRTVRKSGVKVDVVALAQSTRDASLLTPLSSAGGGLVINAADPRGLSQVFTDEAQTLANQILITAAPPAHSSVTEGTLSVSVSAGSHSYTDAAFVSIKGSPAAKAAAPTANKLTGPSAGTFDISSHTLLIGLLAIGVGVLVILTALLGGLGRKPESLESKIAVYTGRGAKRPAPPAAAGVTAQALGVASKALESNKGLEIRLGAKLEAAGLAVKPAEWLLLHAAIAAVSTAFAFVLTGGSLLWLLLGLLGGTVLPWFYLGRKQSKRLRAFNSQLAQTLQLMAGSLQAGLSLSQGMDTIVREGAEPMSAEFRRALVETRLGVNMEDALESMAERMMSDDFKWTVMAIRIQREVGGNLAELMLNVAATLRERDYLRRQVKSLSAEGRFSAYILLAMPPSILLYEVTSNGTYVHPLFVTVYGWAMLGVMGFLMGLGAFMMNRMVKLEI